MTTSDTKKLSWKDVSRQELLDCRIFKIIKAHRRASWGTEADFFMVSAPDWSIIIPRLRDKHGRSCFLMVRQYRHGSSSVTLEFPAGTVDPGESPAATAGRELEEETGYRAERITLIGSINPNPAFMTNTCYTFVAEGLADTCKKQFDEHEMIRTELVPETDIEAHIDSGALNSATMMQALYWYKKWNNNT